MGSSQGKGFFHGEAMGAYIKQLSDRETVTAMCEDYRAGATIDLDEARKDLKEGKEDQMSGEGALGKERSHWGVF